METKSSTSNLSESQNKEDHAGPKQNDKPITSFNKLRYEVLCLESQVFELRVDELWSLAKKFPLPNVNMFQYKDSMRLSTARMREELSALKDETIGLKN